MMIDKKLLEAFEKKQEYLNTRGKIEVNYLYIPSIKKNTKAFYQDPATLIEHEILILDDVVLNRRGEHYIIKYKNIITSKIETAELHRYNTHFWPQLYTKKMHEDRLSVADKKEKIIIDLMNKKKQDEDIDMS